MRWLLHDEWFLNRKELAAKSWEWLASDSLRQLAEITRPHTVISDPDRREELVRLCLQSNGLRPAGESEIQATDRLNTLDSVRRRQLLQETAAAERRAREIREAMAQKKAMESASRYGE